MKYPFDFDEEWTSSIFDYDLDFHIIFLQLLRRKNVLQKKFTKDWGSFFDGVPFMEFKIRKVTI